MSMSMSELQVNRSPRSPSSHMGQSSTPRFRSPTVFPADANIKSQRLSHMPAPVRRSKSARQHLKSEEDDRRIRLKQFVKTTFKRKECVHFVGRENPNVYARKFHPTICHCGEIPEKHMKNRSQEEYLQVPIPAGPSQDRKEGKKWDPTSDLFQMRTNAFGEVQFYDEGQKLTRVSKYVRIADSTPIEKVFEMMEEYWRMHEPTRPSLCISVVGGAKDFKLDGEKKEIFNRGLIRAAKTTNAWVLSSGMNLGVMKAVGEAIAEGQTYNWEKHSMSHGIRCLGIAPWGYVEQRELLESEEGMFNPPAEYRVNHVIQHGKPVSLNPHYTHFLLVDDGKRGRYDGIQTFRAAFEKKILAPKEEKGLDVPVVVVVVEGGQDAISSVHSSVKHKIPVVLCDGSGRAADILSFAFHNTNTKKTASGLKREISVAKTQELRQMLQTAYKKTWSKSGEAAMETKTDEFLQKALECCADENLITVFNMKTSQDLDRAILSALLKREGATEYEQWLAQLNLALKWNRVDVAREKIMTDDRYFPPGCLDDHFTTALINDQVEFVKLLIHNGVVINDYLTVGMLKELYQNTLFPAPKPGAEHLHRQWTQQFMKGGRNDNKVYLYEIRKILRKLGVSFEDELYNIDRPSELMQSRAKLLGTDIKNVELEKKKFPNPFRELLLWATLLNRHGMARFFWERGDDSVVSALIAASVYGGLSTVCSDYESTRKREYDENQTEFVNLATRVMDECHVRNPEMAVNLAERRYAHWKNSSTMEIAADSHDLEFMSSVTCQSSLDADWRNGIGSPVWMIGLALVFPPVIAAITFQPDSCGEKPIGCAKLGRFYTAPITKFAANAMSYLVFVLLYSYMLIYDFGEHILDSKRGYTEILVLVWLATLLLEEIRELFVLRAETFWEKIRMWWKYSVWNKLDLVVLLLALLGLALRLTPPELQHGLHHGKVVYTFNMVLLYMRLLRTYMASSRLGPKLVMINKMLQETVMFLLILIVFLLSYGVGAQSMLFPHREFSWHSLQQIFYYPYWQFFGELFLDEIKGSPDACTREDYLNLTRYNNDKGVDFACDQHEWVVPFLLAVYLLMGNVLLLNLLIAIFTNIFDQVQKVSLEIWKYEMYFLVNEFKTKPVLAPPLILIEHLVRMIRELVRCCKKRDDDADVDDDDDDQEYQVLRMFEKECLVSFNQKEENIKKMATDFRIEKMESRIDLIMKGISEQEYTLQSLQLHLDQKKHGDESAEGGKTVIPQTDSRNPTWPPAEDVTTPKMAVIVEEAMDQHGIRSPKTRRGNDLNKNSVVQDKDTPRKQLVHQDSERSLGTSVGYSDYTDSRGQGVDSPEPRPRVQVRVKSASTEGSRDSNSDSESDGRRKKHPRLPRDATGTLATISPSPRSTPVPSPQARGPHTFEYPEDVHNIPSGSYPGYGQKEAERGERRGAWGERDPEEDLEGSRKLRKKDKKLLRQQQGKMEDMQTRMERMEELGAERLRSIDMLLRQVLSSRGPSSDSPA